MATNDMILDFDQVDDCWVFGYGSLIWRPGFEFAQSYSALLQGRHRSLCVYSFVHRGTPEVPGLVLGLDRGGACRGMAFRVDPSDWRSCVLGLRARELVTNVYREVRAPLLVSDSGKMRRVMALTYVVDRNHEQYAGALGHDDVMAYVQQGRGIGGPNRDYVINTYEHLLQMGVNDGKLGAVVTALSNL